MIYTAPHYYHQFHCLAGDCPDTCCAGWQIQIDKRSLEKYRRYPGPLGNRLHNSIDWKEGVFCQYERRCAFLNEENLCDLYAEAGPKMLCATCRNYPRHIEEFEDCREITLSLSCIEAARIILGCQEPVRFLEKEDEREETYEEFDFLLYTKLLDGRKMMLSVLQDRSLPIELRMAMCLAYAFDLQRRADKDRLFLADQLTERYGRDGASKRFAARLERFCMEKQQAGGTLFEGMRDVMGVLARLETLKADWPDYVEKAMNGLYGAGAGAYDSICLAFSHHWSRDERARQERARYGEQLMVYFISTYFCGAVYDGRIYAKAALAVVSTLIIQELCMASFQQTGQLSFEDVVEIAHRYSREAEHSDDNLNLLEHAFSGEEAFSLEGLLPILAGQMRL